MDIFYNKTIKLLTYTIIRHSLTGIPLGAHIHGGAPRGVNADVKHNFTALFPKTIEDIFTNSVLVDEVGIKEADLLKELYYLNINTPQNPGGEIRGQIELIEPEIISRKGFLLEGSQEVPAQTGEACGTMDISCNKTIKVLTYTINWHSLSGNPVGEHIHGEAPRGVNALVKHDFTALLPKTIKGTFTNSVLFDEVAINEADLLKGLYYVNIPTPLDPGGEIRGQRDLIK